MRFFSNDPKENTDTIDDKNSDRAASDTVTLPQQRAGSPWSDAPGSPDTAAQSTDSSDPSAPTHGEPDSADAELADRERHDEAEEDLRVDDSQVRHDSDELVPDPDALATAAHTGDEPVDLPLDDRQETAAEIHDESTPAYAAEGEGTTTYGRDDAVPTAGEPADADASDADAAAGLVADPVEGDAATDAEADDAAAIGDETAVEDAAEFDIPAVAEPAAGEPVVEEEELVAVGVAAIPVTAGATPTGDKPGSVASPEVERLFAGGDSFVERFREIQLRFVDSPKDATTDAATLVDEAIDKLTSALKAQKDGLASDSDDTEQLRIELRAYRDIMNRLTSL